MTEQSEMELEFVDLGTATGETQGNGEGFVPDAPQPRSLIGALSD